MAKSARSKLSHHLELIVAAILALLAIGSFILQALTVSASTTRLETTLFNTLQFLLTVGFTWFGSRAISRSQFQGEMKRFAIGAYRRISDVDVMIQHLHSRIINIMSTAPANEVTDIQMISAVVSDTLQVLQSSKADWADVIGDELLTMQSIDELTKKRDELELPASSQIDDSAVQELTKRIEELKSALPATLKLKGASEEEARIAQAHAAWWIRERHRDERGFPLDVIGGQVYRCDKDPNTFKAGLRLLIELKEKQPMNVQGEDGSILGRVLNASPLVYDAFVEGLRRCYGKDCLATEFVTVTDNKAGKDGDLIRYRVRILDEPVKGKGSTAEPQR